MVEAGIAKAKVEMLVVGACAVSGAVRPVYGVREGGFKVLLPTLRGDSLKLGGPRRHGQTATG